MENETEGPEIEGKHDDTGGQAGDGLELSQSDTAFRGQDPVSYPADDNDGPVRSGGHEKDDDDPKKGTG